MTFGQSCIYCISKTSGTCSLLNDVNSHDDLP